VNKAELVEEIAAATKLEPKDVSRMMEALIATVVRAVMRGDKVVLSGFGTFHRRTRARRTARDIWGDQPLAVPATNVPAFKPGKPFREVVARRRGGPHRTDVSRRKPAPPPVPSRARRRKVTSAKRKTS
jgi:DNA-binding protein HU-beta